MIGLKKNKIGIIIQARMSSSRLPGKILKKLANDPSLLHVYNRCKASKYADSVIIATTTDKSDDPVEKFCKRYKIPYFRGSLTNVLSRYHGTAKKFNIDTIARITADCPLIDPDTIDQIFKEYVKQKCDYISNVTPGERTFPRGLDVEVFSFNALDKAFREATEQTDTEHVTPYIWQNRKNEYKIGNIVTAQPELCRNYRLTVDYPEDFSLMEIIYDKFRDHKLVPIAGVIKFLDQYPKIASVNADCEQRHAMHAPINLMQNKPKIIKKTSKKCLFILGGWAKKNKNGEWVSSGLCGDNLRVIAAKYLWDEDNDLFIITSGGKGKLSHITDMKPLAQIMAEELTKLGVKKNKIIKESVSYNTYEQLTKLEFLIKKSNFDKIDLISNEWHLPRVEALIKSMFPELKKLIFKKKIELISAEAIVLKKESKKWKPIIQKIHTTKRFKDQLRMEKNGVKDILNGEYKIKH